jgi:hypothetical protein
MKKLVAALTTAIIAVALVVVGAAAPVSAHTPTLRGTATCDATTGTWTVSYTFVTTNVPAGAEASTKVTAYSPNASTLSSSDGVGTGTGLTLSTWSSNPVAGVATRTGNWSAKLTQTGIAGSATQASATIHTDWSDKYSADASYIVHFTGTCATTPPPVVTPKDASASVTVTPATCSSPATLVLGTVAAGTLKNATWGTPTYSAAGYTVTATATAGHLFPSAANVNADNTVETLTGALADKLSPTNPVCVTNTLPKCIPSSAVSYTYDPQQNSGTITVAPVPSISGELCSSFYVTAAAWKYTVNNNIWPQTLDTDNTHYYFIDKAGTTNYSAPVTCGQGDIYAAYYAAGQPTPPAMMTAPNTPWAEHFLHDMGFSGPAPTYHSQNPSCLISAPVTGTPTLTVASCTAPTGNSIVLPRVSGGIWTITSGNNSASLPIGTGKTSSAIWGYGTYTITLTDGNKFDAFDVTPGSWSWTPKDMTGVDCNINTPVVTPTAHPVTSCGTTGSIDVPADSDKVHYAITTGNGHTGDNIVTATAQPGYEFGVDANKVPITTETFEFQLGMPVDCIDLAPVAPSVTSQTCVSGTSIGGTISVQNVTGLNYTITAGPTDVGQVISGSINNLPSGTYTVTASVDASAGPNFVIPPGATTAFTEQIGAAADCRTIITSATVALAQCAVTPNGATPQTYVPGTITIVPDADLTWTITNVATNVVTPITVPATNGTLPATYTFNVDAGTYTMTASLTAAAVTAGVSLPVSSWPNLTVAAVNCAVQTPVVTPPVGSVCTTPSPNTTLVTYINVTPTDHVSYAATLDGSTTSLPLVAGYNSETPGTYTVVATADAGYELDTSGATSVSYPNVVVGSLATCNLPTGATWHAGASADPAVCVSSTSQLGTINLTHFASETGKVTYTITNKVTGKIINAGATATKVKVAPGSYTVRAAAVTAGDGISTASVFNVVVAASTTDCAKVTTTSLHTNNLAFTGVSATFGILGFLLAVGMLFLGFAVIVIRRANRRNAQ